MDMGGWQLAWDAAQVALIAVMLVAVAVWVVRNERRRRRYPGKPTSFLAARAYGFARRMK